MAYLNNRKINRFDIYDYIEDKQYIFKKVSDTIYQIRDTQDNSTDTLIIPDNTYDNRMVYDIVSGMSQNPRNTLTQDIQT